MSIRLDDSEDNISTHRRGSTLDIESQSVSTESNSRSFQDTYYYKIIKFFSKFKILYVPILNWALLSFFITMLYKLILKYNTMYETNVLLTTITANVLLYGLSDTLAQNISCFLAMVQQKNNQRTREGSIGSIQLGNYTNAFSDQPDELALYTDFDEDIFNFHRFVGFMFWGFVMAFVQICWYWVLNHFYTQEPTFVSVLERVMSDQLVFSPISLFCFFSYSNFVLEGGNKYTLSEKIRKIYFSTLIANYMVWPLVQFINFLVMPKQFQVPFSSSIGVIWNCFLSMRNAAN
ncbi:hypothetical protein WICANDRAFT_54438 [Wickerhamomyces anomalus NRRL Y-366-8]|uniref:Uncharacterized protein n=1 Tax=Wickerhamomyces anomalus (strain ATCC 58044 / CBS 1984 / NCYC 433 / NRRL Y-366-8) TaxID=683960 RepID=A0A1E3P6L2_WICAA|nr:uncharacterized protein WICANDRAFT_54438 [Wickerhamomyces anomalus NRRL Y-366-8]ODQ60487.1 hypothetical protein WICANDRAFT_54438 [Wickerhamomyces anomalus NRRL Y-366-8]